MGSMHIEPKSRVEVTWNAGFELIMSLSAFLSKRNQAIMDLGPSWAKEVRGRLDPDLASRLKAQALDDFHYDLVELAAIHGHFGETAADFLDWLARAPADELNDLMAKDERSVRPMTSAELVASRDSTVSLLRAWNDAYFQHLDPGILHGLRCEAEAKRELSQRLSSQELIEVATHGICFEPRVEPDVVLLVPQWHYRPWNVYADHGSTYLFLYPADVLPTPPDQPPLALLRVSRALGDESRLRILRSLAERPRSFTDLVKLTGLSKSTVNHHMVVLRAAGLVTVHDLRGRGLTYSPRFDSLDDLDTGLRAYLKGGTTS
jgi:DNA-binding transcriptional ArsR family regulator